VDKYFVFRAGIDNAKFPSMLSTFHGNTYCRDCHGGTDGTADRAAAHAGMTKIPGSAACGRCHDNAAILGATSLHTTVKGFEAVLAGRGFDFGDATSLARYEKQCAKCHLANAAGEAACGHCHVSVPDSAGGGLVVGHRIQRQPDTVSNCTACHGSRVKDEYFGLNQALFARNLDSAKGSPVPADYVFRGVTLQPDVHKAEGMGCGACHYAAEMHGAGVAPGIDRYGVTGGPICRDCHAIAPSAANRDFHTAAHVESMSCHVCHAQPYKSCFGCHTQEKPDGTGYFANNESDPTRAARKVPPPAWASTTTYAAGAYVTYGSVEYRSLQASNLNNVPTDTTWWVAENAPLPAGDALITFRVGNNPKFGTEPGAARYAPLRHAPVDGEVFTYTEEGTQRPGLIPNLTGLSTWKYASPHNIQRVTLIQSACTNCHGAGWSSFWLTDAAANSFGWVPESATWEGTANQAAVRADPLPPLMP
jgi:hypothetical protein